MDIDGIFKRRDMPWAEPVCWQYTILINEEFGKSTEEVASYLAENNVETRPIFNVIPSMPPYESDDTFPVAEELSRKGLSLPSSPNLTGDQIRRISKLVIEAGK